MVGGAGRLADSRVRAGVSRWSEVKSTARRVYRRNAYRVLLTRARQGVVLYVPRGEAADSTRRPEEFSLTAAFLVRCGATEMRTGAPEQVTPSAPQGMLF